MRDAATLMTSGKSRMLQHDYTGALSAFQESLDVVEKNCGPTDVQAGLIRMDMAAMCHLLGRYTQAEHLYRQALVILETAAGPDGESTAIAETFLAKLLMLERRNSEAEALFERAIPTLENSGDRNAVYLAVSLADLAEAYRIDGRYSKAEPFYRRLLEILQARPVLINNEITAGLSQFPPMLRKMRRKNEARELDSRIKSMLPK
jgi:tetratricopeptide (TPR) repeat protein